MAVAIYGRYSSAAQDGNLSPELQLRRCREFLASHPTLAADPVEVFIDRGISGASFNRPQFMEMERRALAGEFKAIVVYQWSRFGRDTAEGLKHVKRFEFKGVAVCSATESADPVARGIHFVLGEAERSSIARRCRDGLRENAHKGYWNTFAPYGYRLKPVRVAEGRRGIRNDLEVEPERAKVVHRVFELYANSLCGLAAVAKTLNRDGVLTPKRRPWDPGTIRGMLRNPIYSGKLMQGRQRRRRDPDTGQEIREPVAAGDWIVRDRPDLQIIEPDLWKASQELLKKRAMVGRGGTKSYAALLPSAFLVSGLIHCSECKGGLMVVEKSINPRGTYWYLVCSNRKRKGGCANHRRVPVSVVEDVVLELVEARIFGASAIEKLLSFTEDALAQLQDTGAKLRTSRERELAEVARKIETWLRTLEENPGAPGSVFERVRELEARRDQLKKELSGVAKAVAIKDRAAFIAGFRRRVEAIQETIKRVREREEQPTMEFRRALQGLVQKAVLDSTGRLELTLPPPSIVSQTIGAGDGDRTHDFHVGNVTLCR